MSDYNNNRRIPWIAVIAVIALIASGIYSLFNTETIAPVEYTPSANPGLKGVYAQNDRLASVERLYAETGIGPEDIFIAPDGDIYTGYADGRVLRLDADGDRATEIGNTGGRPLGIGLLPDGALVIADADLGLVRMEMDGRTRVLATQANGRVFRFTDDLAVGSDGSVYFTDASWRYGKDELMLDALDHGGYGRVLRWTSRGGVDELTNGLQFANGITLAPDERSLLFTETWDYLVKRLWLRGPDAGQTEIVIDGLPGFPDNINYDPMHKVYWLALYAPRNPTLDRTAGLPWLRRMIAGLPEFMHPGPVMHGIVLALDESGQVVANLQDPTGKSYAPVTSAMADRDYLYMGSLLASGIARLPINQAMESIQP